MEDPSRSAPTKLADLNNHHPPKEEEEYDTEAWELLTNCFREVQSVLDQNRTLIQQVNDNHQSKVPDNLVKNVSLIREINNNISKVSRLYSHLSVDFCNIVHQRRESKNRSDDVDVSSAMGNVINSAES